MTDKERELIGELEAKGRLPWTPGMMAEKKEDGVSFMVVGIHSPLYLYDVRKNVVRTDCTHAPCDALKGWLVEQFTEYDLLVLKSNFSEGWFASITSPTTGKREFYGETLLGALLRAFRGKMEVERGA